MSIADLIATHANRNAVSSPMELMSNAYQLQGAKQLMDVRKQGMEAQGLDMQTQQHKLMTDKNEQAKQFAANVAADLKNTQDPTQKQQKYSIALEMARRNGHDVSMYPTQYDERAAAMMDAAYAQVYEPMRFEAMLNDRFGLSAGTQEFNSLIEQIKPAMNAQGQFDESKATAAQRAAAIKLGLVARASLSESERIAMSDDMTNRVADSKAIIKGAESGSSERAKLDAKLEKEPDLEAAKTRAVEAEKLKAKINEQISKTGRDAEGVKGILDIAEKLIPKSTASGIGTVVDAATGLVGVSTEGADTAESLRSLEGALIMKMPRMEGPQSNMDQQLYRQMAAKIGDSTVPVGRRMAALNTLRELTDKYATPGPVKIEEPAMDDSLLEFMSPEERALFK